ncbi:NAD(P)-dependent oxidoreductase [Arthrobacter alkaliphilus]|uniref:NAD(P)-dependent oxidoreductase n=1 Tax=Arthrobacter alkaliphilus TaxID=369936 RepID=UPI001F1C946B|nr:NAD(P)-dependent oxidoreductase [Arthrobacter alkaliphilus]
MSVTGTPTVAVLGTGIMGAAMARSVRRAGITVRAWNRTLQKAEPLRNDGITVMATAAEAVAGADFILTMLYDGDAVRAAMDAAHPGFKPGAIWIQSTTVGIDDIGALGELAAEYELTLVDAPVLGTRQPAEAGQLIILAAGPTEVRPSIGPVFDAIGARTVWTGEDGTAGTGTRLKLVANSWVIAATNAAGETIALAQALGVDPQSFFDAIGGGGLDMPYLRLKAGLILDDALSPASFAAKTAAKDARLIVDAAHAKGIRLDLAEAGAARLRRVTDAGRGDEDMAAAYFASFIA